jgi:hypothetical protein
MRGQCIQAETFVGKIRNDEVEALQCPSRQANRRVD